MDVAGQQPVFDALQRALEHARGSFGSTLQMQFTGVNKFAAETREHGLGEVQVLTYVSLGLSFVLLFVVFRSVVVFAYLLLPIVAATLWSLVLCFALFDRVHVVAITFTTVLVGVALDYGIYTLIHARRTAGGLAQALREIRSPLVAGCLTSVGGFVFMTLTNLPMLQQMGLAVAMGLLFALTLDFLYLPWVPAVRQAATDQAATGARRRLVLGGSRFPMIALGTLAAASGLVYASHVQWSDDIQTLSTMSPKLLAEQTFLRGLLFGQGRKQRIVLTFGPDLNTAFAHLAKFNATLAKAATGPDDSYLNLGKLVPTEPQIRSCQNYFRAHPDFAARLHEALSKDFNADAFGPFWADWQRWLATNADPAAPPQTPARLIVGLREVLPLPLQNLWNEEQHGVAWLGTQVSDDLYARLPPSALEPPNTPIDQVKTINAALRRYRIAASERAAIGLGIIVIGVLAIYGWRHGGFMLIIPTLSLLLALAALGFRGQPLGLLHVVALLLGFCLASDYSIFLGSPGELPGSTRHAILLAATTALLSFGVLTFSHVEALKDICLTVTLVIASVLVLCEVAFRLFIHPIDAPTSGQVRSAAAATER
jgi:predicted exporter